jgi:hypothetical protein
MTHQTDTESPQPVAEAESLVGVAMHDLLAVVTEINREWPKYGPPSANAKILIFDPMGGQTCVEIPVLSIVEKLECGDRYHLTVAMRKMEPGESFHPANVKVDARIPASRDSECITD